MALKGLHSFLFYDGEENKLYYLGYQMKLTRSEQLILLLLAENTDRYVSADEIAGAVNISQSSVPVHVSAVNEKAAALGGRNIVECRRGCGYRLFSNL